MGAQARHITRQAEKADQRILALTSQKARRLAVIKRDLDAASHPDIAVMKAGELRAAEASFDRLIAAQRQAAGRIDLTAQHLATIRLEVVAP